VEDCLL
jgi:hypothetical protein